MISRPSGSYGMDAPGVLWLWSGLAVVCTGFAVGSAIWRAGWWSWLFAGLFALTAVVCAVGVALHVHVSQHGKFVLWRDLLSAASLPSQPRPQALDLGCGRGAVAIMVAREFQGTTVVGLDLWRRKDQSGNGAAAAQENARRNGVAERVRFDTGDMVRLPYADGSFALVTASLSLHNIPTETGRSAAVREAARVLRTPGQLLIVDIQRADEYAAELRRLGLEVSGPRQLGWRGWWTGPWLPTAAVVARKG
ncbi:2-methoxy-6-polyprenyl-1,4-benzoquinol methylase, mitochondrial [Leucobacter sp. BZR 635]